MRAASAAVSSMFTDAVPSAALRCAEGGRLDAKAALAVRRSWSASYARARATRAPGDPVVLPPYVGHGAWPQWVWGRPAWRGSPAEGLSAALRCTTRVASMRTSRAAGPFLTSGEEIAKAASPWARCRRCSSASVDSLSRSDSPARSSSASHCFRCSPVSRICDRTCGVVPMASSWDTGGGGGPRRFPRRRTPPKPSLRGPASTGRPMAPADCRAGLGGGREASAGRGAPRDISNRSVSDVLPAAILATGSAPRSHHRLV